MGQMKHQKMSTINDTGATSGISSNSITIPTEDQMSNEDSQQQQQQTVIPSSGGPIRVPGTYPPEWLPDHETDTCMACDNLFTLIKRRHHCRSCGKIFCGDCCRLKARLLYLDNKEARVCNNCHQLIEFTLANGPNIDPIAIIQQLEVSNRVNNSVLSATDGEGVSTSNHNITANSSSSANPIQGVLKTTSHNVNNATTNDSSNSSNSNSIDPSNQANKQVIFSDGIRPGTDLSESSPYPSSSTSSTAGDSSFSLLTRQSKDGTESRRSKRSSKDDRNITVCDELGYLPPIVICKNSPIGATDQASQSAPLSLGSNPITTMIVNHFKSSKTIQASMESRSNPLNGIVKFEEISELVGLDNTVTFLLLKDFYLKVKLVEKSCCIDRKSKSTPDENNSTGEHESDLSLEAELNQATESLPKYWCFASEGLAKFGQCEFLLVLDKDPSDDCVPRDVFKIYLTLHELSLRRQSLENLGNLLFQDGLFGNRDTAGLVFVKPLEHHCQNNLVLPKNPFLVALVLQRWEVPWSKVFPMRLLLRLGHKFDAYPYPIVSLRAREPVYYEVGHTIISILGDFRNFRYSITHVDGLKVMIDKSSRKVLVQINQANYQQFNKVLDSSNNEHVLAWSSCPFPEADGHLVAVQNEDGQYETTEFLKKAETNKDLSFKNLESSERNGSVLGASFIIFSGALKVNQSGQSAKISIVEDGLLVQIQSCTMSALKNSIHYMHHFDIDCENEQDPLNRVEIDWLSDGV